MTLKPIYQNLGLKPAYDREIIKFNRRLKSVISDLDRQLTDRDDIAGEIYNDQLLNLFCFNLGVDQIFDSKLSTYFYDRPEEVSFKENIFRLSVLLSSIDETDFAESFKAPFRDNIKKVFDIALVDLGYIFTGREIIKSGAKELDATLLIENLTWLNNYPDSQEKYSTALKHYLTKNFEDAVTNAYSALEGIVKTYLNSDARLDNEKTILALVRKLSLDGDWGQLLHNYCKISHEFSSRHGKKVQDRPVKISPALTEFFIYMTGAVIRLISKTTLSAPNS